MNTNDVSSNLGLSSTLHGNSLAGSLDGGKLLGLKTASENSAGMANGLVGRFDRGDGGGSGQLSLKKHSDALVENRRMRGQQDLTSPNCSCDCKSLLGDDAGVQISDSGSTDGLVNGGRSQGFRTDQPDVGDSRKSARKVQKLDSTKMWNSVGGDDRADFYQFRLKDDSSFRLQLQASDDNVEVSLIDGDTGKVIAEPMYRSGGKRGSIGKALTKGTYFLKVTGGRENSDYRLRLSEEPGSSFGNAQTVKLSEGQRAVQRETLEAGDKGDCYKLSFAEPTDLALNLEGLEHNVDLAVYNNAGNQVASSQNFGNESEAIALQDLGIGDYYVKVLGRGKDTKYRLSMLATPKPCAIDDDDSLAKAKLLGNSVKDSIGRSNRANCPDDQVDYSRFEVKATEYVTLNLDGMSANANVELIQDTNNNGQVDTGEVLSSSANGGASVESINRILTPGAYYVRVTSGGNGAATDYVLGKVERSIEGSLIRADDSKVYEVQNGTRHLIPDRETFIALKLDEKAIKNVANEDRDKIPLGEARPSVTPTPSPNPTPSPSPNPTPSPTPNPTPSPSPNPTPSPTPNPTPSPSPNPTPSPTPVTLPHKYQFTYFYNGENENGSDYYTGWVIAEAGKYKVDEYYDGSEPGKLNETGKNGMYRITKDDGEVSDEVGRVYVEHYYDIRKRFQDGIDYYSYEYEPVKYNQKKPSGEKGLGSEDDTIGSMSNANSAFGLDKDAYDLPEVKTLFIKDTGNNLGFVEYSTEKQKPYNYSWGKGYGDEPKETPNPGDYVAKESFRLIVQGLKFLLPNGAEAYFHYLDGTGNDRTFSYDDYVKNDKNGAIVFNNLTLDTKQAVEKIYRQILMRYPAFGNEEVNFQITTSAVGVAAVGVGQTDKLPYPETGDWQAALGSHAVWINADIKALPGGKVFTMNFKIHAEDKYDFNPGQRADIRNLGGIDDSVHGRFEVVGLAKSYINKADLSRNFTWDEGQNFRTLIP
jgi:hypothetical protein